MPFPKFVNMTKNTPFFSNFACFCTPEWCTRVHRLVLKNSPNYVNFFTRMISNFKYKWTQCSILTFWVACTTGNFSWKWAKCHKKLHAQAKFYMHRANSTCICNVQPPKIEHWVDTPPHKCHLDVLQVLSSNEIFFFFLPLQVYQVVVNIMAKRSLNPCQGFQHSFQLQQTTLYSCYLIPNKPKTLHQLKVYTQNKQ